MPNVAGRRYIHRRTADPKLGPPRSKGLAGVRQRALQRKRLRLRRQGRSS
jgi:hypothetical protein